MKSEKLKIKVDIKSFNLQKLILLDINEIQAKDFIVLFSLLREQLNDSIEILLDNFTIYLKLSKKDSKSICSQIDLKTKVLKATIAISLLEYAIYYLLKYYRDGVAEVEHIDLDFQGFDGSVTTVTIQANNFINISTDEMNRLLK